MIIGAVAEPCYVGRAPSEPRTDVMALKVSAQLEATCRATEATTAWLEQLPEIVRGVVKRWRLTLGAR